MLIDGASLVSVDVDSRMRAVGVENGYDEVNVQIPEEEKRRNLLRQILFRNRFFFTKSFAEETRVIGQELEKGRYAATERVFRSVAA